MNYHNGIETYTLSLGSSLHQNLIRVVKHRSIESLISVHESQAVRMRPRNMYYIFLKEFRAINKFEFEVSII